jgi:hypothetical protein
MITHRHSSAAGRRRWLGLAVAAFVLAPALLSAQGSQPFRERRVVVTPPGPWTGARLPDGQPDVQGFWSNTIGNHNNLTDPQGRTAADDGPPPAERAPVRPRRAGGGPTEKAPSRVSDPADGQVPFQPWARAKAAEFGAHLNDPIRPEYVEPFARCAPGGPTKSFMWHGYEIRQFPGYVVFLFDSGNRVIHLDGKPPLPEAVTLWNGESRGRWEGNTLVVTVTNHNAKARFARTGEFVSAAARLEERFVFDAAGGRFTYHATYTDPAVLTRPFTITIPNKRVTADTPIDDWNNQTFLANFPGSDRHAPLIEAYERICVEGNEGHGNPAEPAPSTTTTPTPNATQKDEP